MFKEQKHKINVPTAQNTQKEARMNKSKAWAILQFVIPIIVSIITSLALCARRAGYGLFEFIGTLISKLSQAL